MHARQAAREAIAALLVPISALEGRVYTSRVFPMKTLPAASVTWTDEERDADAAPDDIHVRNTTYEIHVLAKANAALDDVLDELALDIELALAAAPDLDGAIHALEYLGSAATLSDELEKPAGRLTLRYRATYVVAETDPETIL